MKILSIIKNNKLLQDIIREHLLNNTALNAPYHNFIHHLVVANSCNDAADYYNLSAKDRLELIVAALWHDFNHSMGAKKDDWNVQEAIRAFSDWHYQYSVIPDDSIPDKNNVINIIKATQYPYVIPVEELNLSQKIIRDADLTQLAQNNRIQHVYIGLATEMKLPVKDILKGEKAFLESVVPCTYWFVEMWAPIKANVIAECETFLSYINEA